MKSSTYETKSLLSTNSHVGRSNVIHGSTQIRYVGLNIDSHVNLFMYLIEGIRFGT